LIIRKIVKIIATRQMSYLKAKMHQIRFLASVRAQTIGYA